MADADPRQVLAARLRALREAQWPDLKITQTQLAQVLGGDKPLSVALISSWESLSNPKIPPSPRLMAYAALFATPRSFSGDALRVLGPDELTDEERQAREGLEQELTRLRISAMGAAHPVAPPRRGDPVASARHDVVAESLSSGPWRFEDGSAITIVCAGWPAEMLSRIPYTDVNDPDYIELLTYSELDSLFELYGHLRAANPANQIESRLVHQLRPDDYTSHLISLGGIDWNHATTSFLGELALPVRQVADWSTPDGQYFEVDGENVTGRHGPVVEVKGDQKILRQDVALFARAVNPFNDRRTVTICSGMYGRGTYGAVRALTDVRFRDRNARYLESQFEGSDSYCLLTRVAIVNGTTLTPDWTRPTSRLFEWSKDADAAGP